MKQNGPNSNNEDFITRNNESVDVIKCVRRKNNKICNEDQDRIIVSCQNSKNPPEIAKILEFQCTTVY